LSLELVVFIVVLSLIFQGFFAGSEIALISCDKVKMKVLADQGSKSAKLVVSAFAEIERFVSTTLVGINLTLITSTIIMTFYIHHRFGSGKEYYTVLILSPLIIIFGQVVPKAVFQKKRDTDCRKRIHQEVIDAYWQHGEHVHHEGRADRGDRGGRDCAEG
jgi:putative hemolysin